MVRFNMLNMKTRKLTEEHKKKITIGQLKRKERDGYINSPKAREKVRKYLTGRRKTKEHIENWRRSVERNEKWGFKKGHVPKNKGVKITEYHKKNCSCPFCAASRKMFSLKKYHKENCKCSFCLMKKGIVHEKLLEKLRTKENRDRCRIKLMKKVKIKCKECNNLFDGYINQKYCSEDCKPIGSGLLSKQKYDKLKRLQNKTCAICLNKRELIVDHNHFTNKVRGLLCRGM